MPSRLPAFPTFVFLLISSLLFGQTHFSLSGKVLDKQTRQPVAFAHVGIPEKGIGTTSGFDGAFEFKVPEEYSGSVIIVSFMGYDTWKQPVKNFKNGSTIFLEPGTKNLTEVVVMDQNAIEDIIRRAVKRIPENYPVRPFRMLGFYRESLTDDSLRYNYLAEGVLDIYNPGYDNKKDGQVGLVQGRKINLKNPLDTVVRSGLGSGHLAAHRFDFVRNLIDFLDEKYFPAYRYWIENITTYDGRPVFVIGFDKDKEANIQADGQSTKKKRFGILKKKKNGNSNNSGGEARMKGRIFIEQESYAIIRAEFEILPEALKNLNAYPLYAGYWTGNSYLVNYRKLGNKWYFSDAFRDGRRDKGGAYANDIVITEIDIKNQKQILYNDRLEQGKLFVGLTGQYDADFWKNYNSAPMNAGLTESMQQYHHFMKAQAVFSEENMAALALQRDSLEKARMLAEINREKERVAQEKGVNVEDVSEMDVMPNLKKMAGRRDKFRKVKFSLGLGAHLLPVERRPLLIQYVDKDGQTILSLDKDLPAREFEVVARWEFDIFFHKNVFLRFGHAFDFHHSIYKDWSIGPGLQANLSRQRPVFFRALAQYSYLRYAPKVGNADNDYGKFRVDGNRFKGNSVRLHYGSRLHNLNLSGELAIELNRNRELYFRGTYHHTFSHRQDVWFRERKQLFRSKERTPLDNPRLSVTSDDQPFFDKITPDRTLSFTVGLLFK